MRVAKALWNQQLHRVAQQLIASVAEKPLGLRVHQGDRPLLVGDHDGIGCRLQLPAKDRVARNFGHPFILHTVR